MLFCDTNYAKWCKNWLVRRKPQKVTIYNRKGLLVCPTMAASWYSVLPAKLLAAIY